MDKQYKINYWSEKLQESCAQAAEIRTKWYLNHKLDTFEQYMVMSLLLDFNTYSTLLKDDLALPEPKRSLWKRIFQK